MQLYWLLTAHHIERIQYGDRIEFHVVVCIEFLQLIYDGVAQPIENFHKSLENIEMKGGCYHFSAVVPFLACSHTRCQLAELCQRLIIDFNYLC